MPSYRRIGVELKRKKRKTLRKKKQSKYKRYYTARYPREENKLFLKRVQFRCYFNWKLIHSVNYEDYIWWTYSSFKKNDKFEIFCSKLEFELDLGLPKCIMKIVETINTVTYFNKEIRRFAWVVTWNRRVFKYYTRYYRYLRNEKIFGTKKFLNLKNGHKLHLISWLKNRELTGKRLNKNHAVM